jgi:DNA topoisomerase IA
MPFFLFQNSSDIDPDQSNLNSEQSASESIADLRISYNSTYYSVTVIFRLKDQKVISFGPCQTPTLWFCVQQHKLIKEFRSVSKHVVPYILTHHALSTVHSTSKFAVLLSVVEPEPEP